MAISREKMYDTGALSRSSAVSVELPVKRCGQRRPLTLQARLNAASLDPFLAGSSREAAGKFFHLLR